MYQRLLEGKAKAAPAMRWWPRECSALFDYVVARGSQAPYLSRRAGGRLYGLAQHWGRLVGGGDQDRASKAMIEHVGFCLSLVHAAEDGDPEEIEKIEDGFRVNRVVQAGILADAVAGFPTESFTRLMEGQVVALAAATNAYVIGCGADGKAAEKGIRENALSLGALCAEWL